MTSQSFEVIVAGRMGDALVAMLEGFAVHTDPTGLTHIVGRMADQAELLGLLNTLNGLNIELISVNPAAVPDQP